MQPQAHAENLAELGPKYQFRLLYYACSLRDFGRQIIPHLNAEMFDQPVYKQLVTLIRSYWDKYGQLPNVDNLRLSLIEQPYLSPVDKEIIQEELAKFLQLRSYLADGRAHNDSQQVTDLAWRFVQDRAMRAVRQEMDSMVLSRNYDQARQVLFRMQAALQLSGQDDQPVSPLKATPDVWLNRYPNAVPTGIAELDAILPGGLPPGKLGIFLAGQGVGKSSILTLLADNAWSMGYNVLHVVFDENEVDTEVIPKYHAKWSGVPVEQMRHNLSKMEGTIERVTRERESKGSISIKRFDSAETTVRVLKTWIQQYEERYGVHFDLIVLDYIDELTPENRMAQGAYGEVEVLKSFHSMLVELKRPGWTATQAKKESNVKRLLFFDDCGGSVAKIKKAQVIVTLGADNQQRLDNGINMVLLKNNIGKCGHIWEGCYFDRDTLRLEMSKQEGFVPEEEVRKTYDENEYQPPVIEVAPAPLPARQPSLPESTFEQEGPLTVTPTKEPRVIQFTVAPTEDTPVKEVPKRDAQALVSAFRDELDAA